MKYTQSRFQVSGSDGDADAYRKNFPLVPPPGSIAAKREGCTCRDATSTAAGCPVHPLTYLPEETHEAHDSD